MHVDGRQILVANAGVALGYWVLGTLGLLLAAVHPAASPIWPATGLAIAAVVLWGPRVAPGVFVGAALVNLPSEGWALLIATGNTAEALVGGLLVRRFAGPHFWADPLAAGRFALAIPPAAAISATIGSLALLGEGSLVPGTLIAVWSTWWIGDIVGGLVITPALLLAVSRPRLRSNVEPGLWLAGMAATAGVVFLLPWTAGLPLSFAAIPILLLVAIRAGPLVASWSNLALGAVAIAGTYRGLGSFAGLDGALSMVVLATFLAVAGVSSLVVAAEAHVRRERERQLDVAKAGLEGAVARRTASLRAAIEALETAAAQQQKADEDAQQSRRLLSVAQRIGRVGSWEWDIAADEIRWSDELYRIYGYAEERPAIDFPTFMERIHPDDRERVQQVVGQAMEDHAPFSFDHGIVLPGGEERTLHGEGIVELEHGRPVRMYGTGQDITEQRAAEEARLAAARAKAEVARLQDVADMKSAFLNMAAHELSTPLTPIRIQMHLLRSRPHADPDARSLEVVERNVDRLGELVRDLLETARIESGKVEIETEPTDMQALIADVKTMLGSHAEAQGIELVTAADAHVIDVDAAKVKHVIMNLVSNALKFTPSGGHVRLRATASRDLVIQVTDDGIGLDPSTIGSVFEPFVRVHDTDKVQAAGTGLGLSICHGLVEAHGGKITVSSPGLGMGATFEVRIPLKSGRPKRHHTRRATKTA